MRKPTAWSSSAVGYSGRIPAGAKLQLLVKLNSVSPYKATKTKVTLSGGHGKIHATQGGTRRTVQI